jgi:excisionase family DNA binding protein
MQCSGEPLTESPFVTVRQAANMLGVSNKKGYAMYHAKQLRGIKFDHGVRIDRQSVQAFIRGRQNKPPQGEDPGAGSEQQQEQQAKAATGPRRRAARRGRTEAPPRGKLELW